MHRGAEPTPLLVADRGQHVDAGGPDGRQGRGEDTDEDGQAQVHEHLRPWQDQDGQAVILERPDDRRTDATNQVWLIQQTSPNGAWSAFTNPANGVSGPLAFAPGRNSVMIGMFPSPDGVLVSFQQNTAGAWSGPNVLQFGQTPGTADTQPSVRTTLLPGPTQGQLLAIHSRNGQQLILEEPATASTPWTVVANTIPSDTTGKIASQAAVLDGTNLIIASSSGNGVKYTTHAYTA